MTSRDEPAHDQTTTPAPPPKPSLRLLFLFLERKDVVRSVFPAVVCSIVAGATAPFMTFVVGQAFDAFATFPDLASNPPQSAKDALLRGVGIAALELVALAVGSFVLSSWMSAFWIWTGERNTRNLRLAVYEAVSNMDMEWFDTKMGAMGEEEGVLEEGAPVGAGGLMAKFARDTDDVRAASSLASGMLLQYTTTTIACLGLAFSRSWSLTLVILSAVPILMLIQVFSQPLANRYLATESSQSSVAATLIERAVSAIATVKAFNAAPFEEHALRPVLERIRRAAIGCAAVWGVTAAAGQFVSFAMFVQGFWFGARLVRDGDLSAGDVMAVFWACLIAASNLNLAIPQLMTLAKGKVAMVSLVSLVQQYQAQQIASSQEQHLFVPHRCKGELSLQDVSFAYPSRPGILVLSDVSLFLPANETTFIVGGSGSGKTTIAHLFLRMYRPHFGEVTLDEADLSTLHPRWTSSHVACVSQGTANVVFDMSVHDNVAMGVTGCPPPSAAGKRMRKPQDVTREEVVQACKAAMLHEFIRDLPDGYDTRLGANGATLSGGQRQRLAIARALLRDPTVLILDEATSALDVTSRLLVFEAIKRWRHNKTTVVITHDLSQINPTDFVYVLDGGEVVQQGFRNDLEYDLDGTFRRMMDVQGEMGGYLPVKEVDKARHVEVQEVQDILGRLEEARQAEFVDEDGKPGRVPTTIWPKHHSSFRPMSQAPKHTTTASFAHWMFDAVSELTRSAARAPTPLVVGGAGLAPESYDLAIADHPHGQTTHLRKHSSIQLPKLIIRPSLANLRVAHAKRHRRSLQFAPTSPTIVAENASISSLTELLKKDHQQEVVDQEDDSDHGHGHGALDGGHEFSEMEKASMQRSAAQAGFRRPVHGSPRMRWNEKPLPPLEEIHVVADSPSIHLTDLPPSPRAAVLNLRTQEPERPAGFWKTFRRVYPTIPNKPLLFLGLLLCAISGALVPLFSYLLSQLLFQVSVGAHDVALINSYGGIVLGVAAANGAFFGLKYFVMEAVAMRWVNRLRTASYHCVLAQDKKWFDRKENDPAALVQVFVKDGDDARALIATVLAQGVLVTAMFGVGLVWALVVGWQLTLVGVAIMPVFAIAMMVQSHLVAKYEVRNKRAREHVAKAYYESLSNVRGVRAMALESVFRIRFRVAANRASACGSRGAFLEGATFGLANALIYLAEAVLFYVGAVLIAKGTYTYLRMVETLNLCVFTVSLGGQLMAFTQRIAKATQATADFNRLLSLDMHTDERSGNLKRPVAGAIIFDNVTFAYPARPSVPVLRQLSLRVEVGEIVAVVGTSGSGKSTLAALLQRLYEPDFGRIYVGRSELRHLDVEHLRRNVSVVSQHPYLFDGTVFENLAYGSPELSERQLVDAAQAARVHDFIMALPKGYRTNVGENASLISGGQAQRLAIARALARSSRPSSYYSSRGGILILDECTSALDGANQAAVMDAIVRAQSEKVGRTTIVITHKVPVMRMCDRIVVMQEGEVVEEGTYAWLMQRKGLFTSLANGGEWSE